MDKPKVLKSILVIFFTSLAFGSLSFGTPVQSVSATTYNLKAFPLSGTEIRLEWVSLNKNSYDVWQTTSGKDWTKVGYVSEPNGYSTHESVYSYTYLINSGVTAYRNYYYSVTIKDSVHQYPEGADSSNSSREAVAYPPNRMGHGFFADNTNLCGYCHSTHTAVGPKLSTFYTINEGCISCHDGTGSKYNVANGTVNGDGTSGIILESPSGPFGGILNRSSTANPMSVHSLDQPLNSAPGGNPAQELTEKLSCGSCHDPHFAHNYRSLRKALPGLADIKVQGYAKTDFSNLKEHPFYSSGISDFCMGCHKDYYALQGSGSTPASGTYQTDGKYRHPILVSINYYSKGALTTTLDLEGPLEDNTYVSCITCHFAHGSESKSTDFTNYLLKRDYRGVCEDCHKK